MIYTKFVAAAVQMNSNSEKDRNLDVAERMIETAVEKGAQLVVLPELFSFLGELPKIHEAAEAMNGPTVKRLTQIAQTNQITLCAGSIAIADSNTGNVLNRSILFGPMGQILETYDKIHCFDIKLPDVEVVESAYITHGSQLQVTATPIGHVGQAICYDLRFPELFRGLTQSGMQTCVMPSAFTQKTGAAHWEVLARARAIENQIFLVAPNQCGLYGNSIKCYGNSMIVDPWGKILAKADSSNPEVIVAEIDLEFQREVRRTLPCLNHRRLR